MTFTKIVRHKHLKYINVYRKYKIYKYKIYKYINLQKSAYFYFMIFTKIVRIKHLKSILF